MKFIIAFATLLGVTLALPQLSNPHNNEHVEIVRYENDNIGVDGYRFHVETSDGQVREESAQLSNQGSEDEKLNVRGSYSYVGPDGVTYAVNYVADENGFQPQGVHLPKLPTEQ